MEHWITIMTFQYNHEAYLVKARLENEGIVVNLLDEYISQIQPFYAFATGGIKMQVRSDDVIKAKYILSEIGAIKESNLKANNFSLKINQLTSKIPVLNKFSSEARILILIAILLIVLFLPVFLVDV